MEPALAVNWIQRLLEERESNLRPMDTNNNELRPGFKVKRQPLKFKRIFVLLDRVTR
jgi:hypothetical protein